MSVRFHGYGFDFFQRLRVGRMLRQPPLRLDMGRTLCLPLTRLGGTGLQFRGGIFQDNGRYIPSSGLVTSGKTVVGEGEGPLPQAERTLEGRSLYLGICHYHFGHFLTETLSRLWCFEPGEVASFDHIVLLPLNGHVPAFAYDLFRALGIENRVRTVEAPLALEQVCIPDPAIEYPARVHTQVTALSALFESAGTIVRTDQPLFLSRTALVPAHHRILIGEEIVERVLASQGVRVFHPQQHDILDQIVALQSHAILIGFAGSALHTLMLSRGGKRIFAYSARPVPALFPLLDRALGNDAHYVRVKRPRLPGEATFETGFRPELIDPRPILDRLKRSNIIGPYDLGDYGSPASDAAQVRRFNTALLMRKILEASQNHGEDECRREIEDFRLNYELDASLIEQARQGSELMRRFFMSENHAMQPVQTLPQLMS